MSLHVLDTDIVTLHQHNHPQVIARVEASAPDALAITVVTVEEQMRGRLAQIGRSGVDLAIAYDQLRATAEYFVPAGPLPPLSPPEMAQIDAVVPPGNGRKSGRRRVENERCCGTAVDGFG